MNVDTATSYLEAIGFIVEESGDDSYLVIDPSNGAGADNPIEPQEFVRLAALSQFYSIYPNWNPEIYGDPPQTRDSQAFTNEYYIDDTAAFRRKERIDKMSQVFDSEQAATAKVNELNFLEQQPAGYELGEIEAGIEGEPVVKWEVKRMAGGTYIVVPSDDDEEEEPIRVPELPATQENIPAAQQQASMLTNATGVPHEFYPEGGQWRFRPIEVEAEAEGYSYEEALRDAPPGFQPKPTSDPNQWTFEKIPVLDIDEQIMQMLSAGRYDEAAKLDQIRDQLNTDRLTPERAAEMLVNVAYNPADFKQMMDAMLGQDSRLDPMTSDIRSLQEQAAAMLARETQPVPVMAPMPPPDLIPARMPETALELEGRVTQEGPLGGPLFMPSEAQEGLEEFEPPPSPPIATFQRTPGRPTLIPAAESPMEEVTRVIPRGGLTEEEFAQLFTRADHPGSTQIPYVGGTPERRAALAPYIGAEYADLYDITRRQQEAAEHQKKVRKGIRRVGYA